MPLASASYRGGASGIWFDIDVAWDAGTSTVKVNGIEVLKTTTQLEMFGQVGLSTYGAQARFDNFSQVPGLIDLRRFFERQNMSSAAPGGRPPQ